MLYIACAQSRAGLSELLVVACFPALSVLASANASPTCPSPRTDRASMKQEMSTRGYSSSRLRAPTPAAALVLVLLLLMGSSSWAARVADGVIRTTTPRKLIGTGNNLMCCSATLLAVAGFLRFHVSIFGKGHPIEQYCHRATSLRRSTCTM